MPATEWCGLCGGGRWRWHLSCCHNDLCRECVQELRDKDGSGTCPYCRGKDGKLKSPVPGLAREGMALASCGSVVEAEQVLEEARTLNPRHADTLNCLGRLALARGDMAQAEHFFQELRRSGDPRGALELGMLRAQQRDFLSAHWLFQQARTRGCARASTHLGFLSAQCGCEAEALKLLLEGWRRDDHIAGTLLMQLHCRLARAAQDRGDLDAHRSHVQQAEAWHVRIDEGGLARQAP